MCAQAVNVELLPTTPAVASSLKHVLDQEEIDLRDITAIALQDVVVFINIILLVNKSFQERNRPVVNTVQAAINLLGLPVLREKLLSIKSLDEISLSSDQKLAYNLVRNRIIAAANLTGFWADYMGEKNIEEMYCASMFTGVNLLHEIIIGNAIDRKKSNTSYLDSIENLQELYKFEDEYLTELPDSIQQVFLHASYTNRLSLSVLVYELIAVLELGYATEGFSDKLGAVIEHIDQSASRATYDMSIQIVRLQRNSEFSSFNHAAFLISTNMEAIEPLNAADANVSTPVRLSATGG